MICELCNTESKTDYSRRICYACATAGAEWAAREAHADRVRIRVLERQHAIIRSLLDARQKDIQAPTYFFGPWDVVVPRAREAEFQADYAVRNPTKSLKERVGAVEGFRSVVFEEKATEIYLRRVGA